MRFQDAITLARNKFFHSKKVSDSWQSSLSETSKEVKIELEPPWPLKGGEKFEVDFRFFCCFLQKRMAATRNFFGLKKNVPCQSNRILKSRKYIQRYNNIVCVNFNHDFPTIFLKLDLLLQFWR